MPLNFVSGDDPGQGYLLPPDVRDWLPPGHLAWALRDLAAQLDLSAFTSWYRADGQGRPAYHPAMMVTLVCYCFCKGVRSSRAVEAATYDDLGARVICGNLHPDHSTVHRFLARHEEPVKGLLAQSVVACARQGLVAVDVVAGDGTKVRASASAAANRTLERLDLAAAADAADGLGDGDDGPPPGSGPGPSGRAAATLARRRGARARLAAAEAGRAGQAEAEQAAKITRLQARAERAAAAAQAAARDADAKAAAWQARAAAKAAAGSRKRPDGRRPVPAARSARVRKARQAAAKAASALERALAAPLQAGKPLKINTTDPSSAMMQAKNGGFGQQHNIQVLACKSQVILGIGRHLSPADVAAMHPLLAGGRATLDATRISDRIGAALFDAGYASDANFTTPSEARLYVSV